MKITSINIAQPIEVEYRGRMIRTGIFKKPVAGPVQVTETGIIGDGQADLKNHGGRDKAVYAFAGQEYPYWQKFLELDEQPAPGFFGENLTVDGLDEDDVRIGDQYKVGDCTLVVTQPRVPCFKLGIAVGDDNMPKTFTERAHTGVYFAVQQTGEMRAGDVFEKVRSGPEPATVRGLFRAFFEQDYPKTREIFAAALECPNLSDAWRPMLEKRF